MAEIQPEQVSHAREIIGFLISSFLLACGAVGWFLRKYLDRMDKDREQMEEEIADLHDRLLILETKYKSCCGKE